MPEMQRRTISLQSEQWTRMTKSYRCPNGNPNCAFNEEDEQALVSEVLRTIDSHNKEKDNIPCPLCLRDTMLATAALLHLEAARTGLAGTGKLRAGSKRHREAFGKAARERMDAVVEANTALHRSAH
jgi:hypothetical protein